MSKETLTYIVFGIVLIVALVFDLGLLSKKNKEVSLKQAMRQTIFWVILALAFGIFVWYEDGKQPALQYISAYKFVKKIFPLTTKDGNGKFWVTENGKRKYTTLFIVVMMLASIDLVFALDSIPAVMGISRDKLVIYTSNIFAVLGLRSLFFLLKGAVNKFEYLQQGIAIVLVFIGAKMLAAHWVDEWFNMNTQVFISLGVIIICIATSILLSLAKNKRKAKALHK